MKRLFRTIFAAAAIIFVIIASIVSIADATAAADDDNPRTAANDNIPFLVTEDSSIEDHIRLTNQVTNAFEYLVNKKADGRKSRSSAGGSTSTNNDNDNGDFLVVTSNNRKRFLKKQKSRKNDNKNGNKKKSENNNNEKSYKELWETCEAKAKEPSYLFLQLATPCTVVKERNQKNDDDKYNYRLVTNNLSKNTWAFSDRPIRNEKTIPTIDFVDQFSTVFDEKSGGKPNAAFTFVRDGTPLDEPVVAVIEGIGTTASNKNIDGHDEYRYDLSQSVDQKDDVSLENIFVGTNDNDNDDGRDDDVNVVAFDYCSIFIDAWIGFGGATPVTEFSNSREKNNSI